MRHRGLVLGRVVRSCDLGRFVEQVRQSTFDVWCPRVTFNLGQLCLNIAKLESRRIAHHMNSIDVRARHVRLLT